MNWWQRFKRSSAHTQANIVCTIVIMVATVAYAFTAWRQLRSMNDQLGEIRKSTITAERSAYAACLGAKISRSALIEVQRSAIDTHMSTSAAVNQAITATEAERAEMELLLGNPDISSPFEVPFNLNNAGKTAAIGVDIKFRVVFISKNEEPDFRYPPKQTGVLHSSRIRPGPVLLPGGSPHGAPVLGPNGKPVVPTPKDRNDFQFGEKDVVFYAWMTYRDIFKGRHWQILCQPFHIFAPGLMKNMDHPKCAQYNRSDTQEVAPLLTPSPIPKTSIPEINCEVPK